MTKNKEKFYLSTSIAYTNSRPHVGFALELIQADVVARYNRWLGKDVWFLTGTDEHGSKIARKAKEEGKTPQVFCDEISAKFKELKAVLDLSFDDFIRTTDQKRHWPTVQAIWKILEAKGDLEKRKYKGLYCVGCEAFVTEKDLVEGKCPLHNKEPEIVEEENYFFRLSRYQSQLKEILEKNDIKIFPEGRKNEMLNFIKEGLEDVSCSRDSKALSWGVPVPGDESQTIYVWFEALINYLSALGYLTADDEKFKKYWPCDVHFIGKDIARFHVLLWPAILLGLELSLPKNIFIHGFITAEGQKMSKSLGNVIDPFLLVEKYGTDPVRYFLLREISPTEDGDFSYEKFEERYNADLANGIGNLLARVVTLASKISNFKFLISNQFLNSNFKTELEKTKKKYGVCLENLSFNEALGAVWELISFCDKYVNDNKPWENRDNSKEVVGDLLLALQEIAELLKPFMPQTAKKILQQIATGKSEPLFLRLN
ncbi:MAG: methionine--tRNA ligase [Candidatus Gribaldobacteria bacterium]|nr:methionine--tRNA ligase [Candidatus Gribaldobacteria bacterium]